ncbi:hypothetical protein [Flavobacterium xanthum]|uniref:Uncharacterized protein n=1 Tax=Flavobacterium xanthum TaxID=69322 RepID=A0A1M7F595_9FLAO|nr:hypothetical protein [Flavobacterium xanthum]SHL99165.1 hypothetical protein SAMN05443669_101933 [Flavobacterium xanthum]
MKKLLLFMLFLFASSTLMAQTDGMSYQAILLNPKTQEIPGADPGGNILPNKTIKLRFTILKSAGEVLYQEVHSTSTDAYGMINVVIGQGLAFSGIYTNIVWDGSLIDLKVEINIDGEYTNFSNQSLLFVPYAYHRDVLASGNLTVAGKVGFSGDFIVDGTAVLNKSLTVNNGSATQLTGSLGVDGTASINNTLIVASATVFRNTVAVDGATQINNSVTVTGSGTLNDLAIRTINIKSDNPDFVATYENQNEANGDGLLIKLGRTHGAWNGSGYLNIQNTFAQAYDTPINTVKGWLDGGSFSPEQLFKLMPASIQKGVMAQIGNALIKVINSGLQLPIGTPEIFIPKTKLVNKITFFAGGRGCLPEVCFPEIGICPVCTPEFCITICTPEIPSIVTPEIVFPRITLIPAIPELFPTIPEIPTAGLPSLSIPNFTFSTVTNSLTVENQYITFQDKDGRAVGTIRAQSTKDFRDNTVLDNVYVLNTLSSFVGLDLAGGVASGVAQISNLVNSFNKIGVEYSSGHGDYAEWLERIDQNEYLSAGDVIAVKGGKITKNLTNAEQIMVVSHKPIITGNVPDEHKLEMGNNVAFTGQVPVKVTGPVQSGDYIIASSAIKGYGIAIHPKEMTSIHFSLVVGRSWENQLNAGPKMVNIVVGVQNGDWNLQVSKIQQQQEQLDARIENLNTKLNRIAIKINNEKTNKTKYASRN